MMHARYLDGFGNITVMHLILESNKYISIMMNTTIEIFGCNYTWHTLNDSLA